jgi:hypothetical protein
MKYPDGCITQHTLQKQFVTRKMILTLGDAMFSWQETFTKQSLKNGLDARSMYELQHEQMRLKEKSTSSQNVTSVTANSQLLRRSAKASHYTADDADDTYFNR